MYDQMIYVRASIDDVEKVEEMGFRSGNEEKEAPYFAPLWDTIEFIVRNRHKGTKIKQTDLDDKVKLEMDSLAKQVNLSLLTGLGQRGRTFHNTYAIIDESQGQSRSSLQKMLTRFGQNCKIVIIGSNNQIDNPYVTKYTNGLSVLLDACKRHHTNVTLHAVSLPKVLRGPIAEFAEDLYSNSKVS